MRVCKAISTFSACYTRNKFLQNICLDHRKRPNRRNYLLIPPSKFSWWTPCYQEDKISVRIFFVFSVGKPAQQKSEEITNMVGEERNSDLRWLFTDNLLKDEKRISDQRKLRRRNRKKLSGDSESGYSSMLESGYSSNRDSASENIQSASNLSSG